VPVESHARLLNPKLLGMLRCPLCKGALSAAPLALACAGCRKTYPIISGIPDLRVYEDHLIPLQDDYRKSEKILAQAATLRFAELVRYYWSLPTDPPTPPDLRDRFVRHVLTDEDRIQGYIGKIGRGGNFLEVGCGTAALLKAAHPDFTFAAGCDIALRWLLIARKRLEEAGLTANLVCCCADYLPFPENSFDSIASVSLLEHVSDAAAVVGEFARVASPGARVFAWTANRFSLAPEPHVRVWGVGFLPRRWMAAYVKWARGIAYEKKHLLSCFAIRRLFRKARLGSIRFSLPTITTVDWQHLRGLERAGARLFRMAAKVPLLRQALVLISPVILVEARAAGNAGRAE
jgi:SAM-dependent methyltransferase